MRASVIDVMNAPNQVGRGFKRQMVFRIGTEEWPLLEAAITQHGSIQAAVLAGLRALAGGQSDLAAEPTGQPVEPKPPPPDTKKPPVDPGESLAVDGPAAQEGAAEELPAREAAAILGLKAGTVRGYIRSGRIPGRYVGAPEWKGWLTTRGAVDAYRSRTQPAQP